LLVNDQECVLYRPGGSSTTIPQRFSLGQIGSLLNEVMTEEQRRRFAAGESLTFPYDAGGAPTDIEVTRDNSAVRVCISANLTRSAAGGAGDGREQAAPATAAPDAAAPAPVAPTAPPVEAPAAHAPEPAATAHTPTRGKPSHIDELLRLL